MPHRTFRVPLPVDLTRTLGPLRHGRYDPTVRLGPGGMARASHTPDGPVTLQLELDGDRVRAEAWGPGAGWALEQAPHLVGVHDDLTGFEPDRHPAVAKATHRRPGLRLTRSGRIDDLLVPTILGQKVTSQEAFRGWFAMIRAWGTAAPGPHDLRLPPTPAEIASHPYEDFHPLSIERKRADIVRRACSRFDRLQEAVTLPRDEAHARLTALPGLGPWTAGILMRVAMGDPDAVEVGDYHIPNGICWHLAGEPRGDDARMMELLEPFAGHRGRVVRLVTSALGGAPKYGARMRVGDIRRTDPPRGW